MGGCAGGGRRPRGAPGRAATRDPQPPQRFHVRLANESQANHGGVWFHTVCSPIPVRSKPERLRMPSGLYGTFPGRVDCVSHFGLVLAEWTAVRVPARETVPSTASR